MPGLCETWQWRNSDFSTVLEKEKYLNSFHRLLGGGKGYLTKIVCQERYSVTTISYFKYSEAGRWQHLRYHKVVTNANVNGGWPTCTENLPKPTCYKEDNVWNSL